MQVPVFDNAANWVCQRQTITSQQSVPEAEIAQTISTLHALAGRCQAAVMVPDLFPGNELEMLFIPAQAGPQATPSPSSSLLSPKATTAALGVIGAALCSEFDRTGQDMARYEFGDGAIAIVYLPKVRSTVLQATGLVLLH
jgi:hypothetical protein